MGFAMNLQTVFVWLCVVTSGVLAEKEFYIAAVEDYWDYMPKGDMTRLKPIPHTPDATNPSQVFKKAMYKEFTDATFTTEKPKPTWQGFVGPTLYGEEGEIIRVVFFNNASRVYSIHPHGVLYNKINEGALYTDGNHGTLFNHSADIVEPGDNFTYTWRVTKDSSPSVGDPDCLTWTYHSHVDTVKDTNSGLVGLFLTCRPGALNKTVQKRHYSLYISDVDESSSWYADENSKSGAAIQNTFPAINGFLFGNVPDLDVCLGETVIWYMAGLGTASDVHSLSISGHSFIYFHRREHSINLSVAQFATAETTSHRVGRWLIHCNIFDHLKDGMMAFLNVRKCNGRFRKRKHIRNVRWHYIAAEEIMWDYGPTGRNGLNGASLTKPESKTVSYFTKNGTIGGVYKKAVFRGYEDYQFKTKTVRDEGHDHLGLLGPVIRAEPGDLIEVVFRNLASRPYSLHAEGVVFSKKSEGSSYNDGNAETADNKVDPGKEHTYYWFVPDDMSPTGDGPQCLTRIYTSGVDRIRDTYSGLIGPLLICKNGTLDRYGKQKNVDKEFFLMMALIDENQSWYLEDNIRMSGLTDEDTQASTFSDANQRHSINGFMFGNLPGLDICTGDAVSWHVFSEGTTSGIHSVYFHGNIFAISHTQHSSISLLAGGRRTLYMKADNSGIWEVNCQTTSHFTDGEKALYRVMGCPSKKSKLSADRRSGKEWTYYIQAEEVHWDFAPSGRDLIHDMELPSSFENKIYTKVLYRGYTDESFKTPINQTGEEYLGMLGPIVRVEAGAILKIVFRNKGPRPFSLHAQGLAYRTGRSGKNRRRPDQPIVLPGKTFTYQWRLQRWLPTLNSLKADPPCVNSQYYSDVDLEKDINTGLIGTLVICQPGTLDKVGKRMDVAKDFALYYSNIDENKSWLRDRNIEKCTQGKPERADVCQPQLFTAINGYVWGNQPPPTMPQQSVVDWYLMTMGDQGDHHPVHFHGNDVLLFDGKVHTSDVQELLPGVTSTVRMHAINAGKWLFHCHVNAHINNGMEQMYLVEKMSFPTSTIAPPTL